MGSFHTTGFISKLPIRCRDRVVCFIVSENEHRFRELYIPDAIISPWGLPVRGEYNDYGSVENINHDFNTKLIEAITGVKVEAVFDAVERCLYGKTIEDNIAYWEKCDNDWKKNYNKEQHEADKYYPLLKLFGEKTVFDFDEKSLDDALKSDGVSEEDRKTVLEFFEEHKNDKPSKCPPITLLFEHEAIYDEITSKNIKWGWDWDDIPVETAFENHLKIQNLEDEARKIIDEICNAKNIPSRRKLERFSNIFSVYYTEKSPMDFDIFMYTDDELNKDPECMTTTPEQKKRVLEIKDELEKLYEMPLCFGGRQYERSEYFMNEFKMLDRVTYMKALTECRDELIRFVKLMQWLNKMPMLIGLSRTGDQDYNRRGFVELYDYLGKFSKEYFEDDLAEEEDEE